MLMPVAGAGDPAHRRACNRVLAIFDGAPALRHHAAFRPHGRYRVHGLFRPRRGLLGPLHADRGHRPDRDQTKFMAANRDMEVWLMPIKGTRVLAPGRIVVGTQIGRLDILAPARRQPRRVRDKGRLGDVPERDGCFDAGRLVALQLKAAVCTPARIQSASNGTIRPDNPRTELRQRSPPLRSRSGPKVEGPQKPSHAGEGFRIEPRPRLDQALTLAEAKSPACHVSPWQPRPPADSNQKTPILRGLDREPAFHPLRRRFVLERSQVNQNRLQV